MVLYVIGAEFLEFGTNEKAQRKCMSLGPLRGWARGSKHKRVPEEMETRIVIQVQKLNLGPSDPQETKSRHHVFCHQAQPPNWTLSPSIASPIPLATFCPQPASCQPQTPTHKSPFSTSGGTVPLLGKSTPVFPATQGPPFNSHLLREPGTPPSPCSQLQPPLSPVPFNLLHCFMTTSIFQR